jgi:hypothetical protein
VKALLHEEPKRFSTGRNVIAAQVRAGTIKQAQVAKKVQMSLPITD